MVTGFFKVHRYSCSDTASKPNANVAQVQSTYRKLHSTEMALTYVINDILCALDRQETVFIVLLDLSTVFDTVNHKLLLSRLDDRVGLSRQVCDWVISYLTGRYQ